MKVLNSLTSKRNSLRKRRISRILKIEQLENRLLLNGSDNGWLSAALDINTYEKDIYATPGVPDRFEDNDSMATATDLGVIPGVHIQGLSIEQASDNDWYKVELLRGDDISFSIDFTHADGDLALGIANSAGTTLALANSSDDNENVNLSGLTAGTYYAYVTSSGTDLNDYDLSIEPSSSSSTRVLYVNNNDTTNDYYTLAVGDDLNDGLSPLTPKATVADVLADYDLNVNDLVLVDTGTYGTNVVITKADESAAYGGSPGSSIFNAGGNRFELIDADYNIIYGMNFQSNSNYYGIWAHSDGVDPSTNNIFRNNTADRMSIGFYLQNGSDNQIIDNTVTNSGWGVRPHTETDPEISGNNIANNTYGITIEYGSNAFIDNNTLDNGSTGIRLLNNTTNPTVSNNSVTDFTNEAIYIYDANSTTISGNEVSYSGSGIYSREADTEIYNNLIHDNTRGIYGWGIIGAEDWDSGLENDIYNNTTGIQTLSNSTSIQFNKIHGNDTGIYLNNDNITVSHNLIYRNNNYGMLLNEADNINIINNTIYAPTGDGVKLENNSSGAQIRNNIIWVDAGYDLNVATDSQVGFESDYNNLYATGTGKVVWWQKDFTDLFDWQVEANYDTHSIGYTALLPALDNPQFANLAGDNYHLTDVVSTSIDSGKPSDDYSKEPGSDGYRINLGAYGNTTQAAESPLAAIKIAYPNFYTDWQIETPNVIDWDYFGIGGNLNIDLYQVGVGKIADIAEVPISDGSFVWAPFLSGLTGSTINRYYIKLTAINNASIATQSREAFAVPPNTDNYYVDDASNIDDQYTPTAIGNNRNTGTTANDPKANLLPMLRSYDMGPGDTTWIDTGYYNHVRNVIISGDSVMGNDEGATFSGPTDSGKTAQIDRDNPYTGSTNIDIDDGDYVTLQYLTLSGGDKGLWVHNSSTNFHGEHLVLANNIKDGLRIEADSEASTIYAISAYDNGQDGISVATSIDTIGDSTAYNNSRYGMNITGPGTTVRDSEIYSNNSHGIYAASNDANNPINIIENVIHDNYSHGIYAQNSVAISNNEIYGQTRTSQGGIYGYSSNITVQDNDVHDNYYGINLSNYCTAQVIDNTVYNNNISGIEIWNANTNIIGNVVYSNPIGIHVLAYGANSKPITNNIIYSNTDKGLVLENSRGVPKIENNTFYSSQGSSLHIKNNSSGVRLTNNIFYINGGYGINVDNDSQTNFDSNYNLIYTDGTGQSGYWQTTARATLLDWQNATFADFNSLDKDPMFVDKDGADNILGGINGTDDNFHLQSASPAIDRGDLQSYYLTEPWHSGGRINIGAYGNTATATASDAEVVQVLSPNGAERYQLGQNVDIQWRSYGLNQQAYVSLTNAGSGTIDNWLEDAYRIGGNTTSYTNAVDLSGISNPGPTDIYQSIAYSSSGVGNTFRYDMPVPDGSYDVRLHFVEHYYSSVDSRVFDVTANGTLALDNYDIYAQTGQKFKAIAETISVVAAGGQGIVLEFENVTYAPSMIAAVEIVRDTTAGVASPTVDLSLSIDNKGSFAAIAGATGLTMDIYGRGSFNWAAGPISGGINSFIRAESNDSTMPTDDSDDAFEITEPINIYYVNDSAFEVGDWTIAVGVAANDGLSPSTPKDTIRGILEQYDLGIGDIIKVDSGSYLLSSDVLIEVEDAGVTIEGYHDLTYPARKAVMDRANTNQTVIHVQADDVSLQYLNLTGGRDGVWAENADNLTVANSNIYANERYGIQIDVNSTNAQISSNIIDGNSRQQDYGVYAKGSDITIDSGNIIGNHYSHGIYVDNDNAVIMENEVYGNRQDGIYVANSSAAEISGNIAHNNDRYGIYISGSNSETQNLVLDNIAYNNGSHGIYATTNVMVTGNETYGHVGNDDVGIYLNGAIADGNITHDNYHGISIYPYSSSTITNNISYHNSHSGIIAYNGSIVKGNQVYANDVGIDIRQVYSFTGQVSNNLVYDNISTGIVINYAANGAKVENNTIYQPLGNALIVQNNSTNLLVQNNIISVDSGYGIYVAENSQTGFASDYNLFDVTGTGKLGYWEGVDFDARIDWFYELGLDANSLEGDPQFIDIDGADNIRGYDETGSVNYGTDDNFHLSPSSPGLDGGSLWSYYLAEPTNSGGRINMGTYGNTPEAAASPIDIAQVISPNGFEKFELGQDVDVQWRIWGQDNELTVALLNAGGTTQDNWLTDSYRTAGNTTINNNTIDTSGITNPAPQTVYQQFAYAPNGVGNKLAYNLPVYDGDYTVKLHFVENYYTSTSSRVFDIYSNGALAVDNYDIYTAAGDRHTAVIEELIINAAAGNGIQLEFVNETYAYAELSAIEIIRINPTGAATPTVDLSLSTDNGGSYSAIAAANGLTMDYYGRGHFNWSANPVTNTNLAKIQVRANQGLMQPDESDQAFLIANNGTEYYVNDNSLTGDIFTSAVGSNLNSGKSPDAPMASLRALLAAYDLDAGDTINVDAGNYDVIRTIVFDLEDSGVTINGADDSVTIFDRGNVNETVIDLYANNVTIEGLTITGGYDGIYANNADGLTMLNSTITNNARYGVYLSTGSDNASFSSNNFDGSSQTQDYGIYTEGAYTTIEKGNNFFDHYYTGIYLGGNADNSTITSSSMFNNRQDGIRVNGAGGTDISSNQLYDNGRYGIYANGSTNESQVLVRNNQVHDNNNNGIYLVSNTLASNNKVYNHNGHANYAGIYLQGGYADDNEVYDNSNGILTYAYSSATITNNTIYNNADRGITAGNASVVSGNKVYSNSVGIESYSAYRFNGTINNNLVYDNSNHGIMAYYTNTNATFANNTVYQSVGNAFWVKNSSIGTTLKNNIIYTNAGYGIYVENDSQTNFHSDHNIFYITGTANLASFNAVDFNDLTDWYYQVGEDANSLTGDPQFIDIDGADNILGYDISTSSNHGTDDDFHLLSGSIAIDAGDPGYDYLNEPMPNGMRINIGAYGNTADATTSPTEQIQILSPNGMERFQAGQNVTIQWQSIGLPAGTIDIVLVDSATNTVADLLANDIADTGSFSWTVAGTIAQEKEYVIRIIANSGTNPQDDSNNPFVITNDGNNYYINNMDLTGDIFTTAMGNNANSGKLPSKPMYSLQALVNAYDLNPGDTIYVDAGDYHVVRSIVIDTSDAGVNISGLSANTAKLDRNNIYQNVITVEAEDIIIRGLEITDGYDGIYAANADNLLIQNSWITSNAHNGVHFDANSDHGTLYNNRIDGDGQKQDYGIYSLGSYLTVDKGNVVFDNYYDGVYTNNDYARITSNEFYDNRDNGIQVSNSANALISGNAVHNNLDTGITVSGSGNEPTITVSNNNVYNNGDHGIEATTNVLVTENTIYGHSNGSKDGIWLNGATATENIVHSNFNGIESYVYATSIIDGNTIFNNSNIGILANNNSLINANQVYSNSVGISTIQGGYRFTGNIQNNLVYANANQGIVLANTNTGAIVTNNTVYQEVGDAIRVQANSVNVQLANNILWVEAGYAIHVAPNSLSGFDSNYNLFYVGFDPNGHVGNWNGNIADGFGTWQFASGQDANSLFAIPLFVDIDGADDILGYSTVGNGYDGGSDDNFILSAGSPAIDRANSFKAPSKDIVDNIRVDDPGTTNGGSDDYAQSNLGPIAFNDTSGTAQNWRYDNNYWALALPFNFNFYGIDYSSVYVSSNGFLQFGSTTDINDTTNSNAELLSHTRIAAMWDDLKTNGTGDDIFVDETIANQVTIRWKATNKADDSDVNFAIKLFSTGEIQFDYGAGNTNLTPTVGISAGDSAHYEITSHNTQPILTDADTLQFVFESGIADIGAYEFVGSSSDTTPPTVVSVDPTEIETSAIANLRDGIVQVVFSEAINPIDATAIANYDLRCSGADGVFDTFDDVVLGIHDIIYMAGSTLVTLPIDGGVDLVSGQYRFTISGTTSIHDLAALKLDGNGDGTGGDDYVKFFDVVLTGPKVEETIINDGDIQRSEIFTISARFNENVTITSDTLTLYNTTINAGVDLSGLTVDEFSYNALTFTATWDLSGTELPDGNYLATLDAWGITNGLGNPLDGNSDGTEGDDHAFVLHRMLADANGDRKVDRTDSDIWKTNYDPFGNNANTPGNGDWNLDGKINSADLFIWQRNFDDTGLPIPAPPATEPVIFNQTAPNLTVQTSQIETVAVSTEKEPASAAIVEPVELEPIAVSPIAISDKDKWGYKPARLPMEYSLPAEMLVQPNEIIPVDVIDNEIDNSSLPDTPAIQAPVIVNSTLSFDKVIFGRELIETFRTSSTPQMNSLLNRTMVKIQKPILINNYQNDILDTVLSGQRFVMRINNIQ
ncbi:MAG: right-handed parallel beta-helix repeat-containing protein [Phycisphaerae bacterium]|nr:right-handed parallel beta-helix repeat-containing protein [Phycisphaerae bacterium]